MITKEKKGEIIKNLSDKFSRSKAIVFLGFQGLSVEDSMELRRKLRSEDIDYKVAKKTLIKKGLKDAKVLIDEELELELEGPVAVAIGYNDEIAPARLSREYAKSNNNLKLLGGFISAKYINAKEIKALALLPDKNQLRAQLARTINAPISGFVNVLAGNMRGFVNVLKAIGDAKNNN